jgi:hypothetical protein
VIAPGWSIGICLALALLVTPCQAQINVANNRALAFGKFVAGIGGTITVDPNGARSRSGGVFPLVSSAASAASFNVSDVNPANAGLSYIITLPDNGTVALSSGAYSMPLNDFSSIPAGSGMLTAGSQILTVGATLSVSPNQPPGNYSGNFNITLNYQ